MGIIKRYKAFILVAVINLIILIFFPAIGEKALALTGNNALEMLAVLPPIFILLGLLDVWVKKETMMKFMGEKSGMVGVLIAFFMGSAAAGPLYAAFPVAAILLQKGSKFSNVLIFIGAWSTTKIPMLFFEASAMGLKFMITRFLIDIFGIAIIAFITDRSMSEIDKQSLYDSSDQLGKR